MCSPEHKYLVKISELKYMGTVFIRLISYSRLGVGVEGKHRILVTGIPEYVTVNTHL
jgi:hypothetical protein